MQSERNGGDKTARRINGETVLLSSCSKAIMTDKQFIIFLLLVMSDHSPQSFVQDHVEEFN